MPGPKVRVAKDGVNVITGSLVNMAFDSDYNLNKIARAQKLTSATPVAHGLPYTPKIMAMRETTTGKFGWGGSCSVDGTNLSAGIRLHVTSYNPYASDWDVATWVYTFIDPLVSGTFKKNMRGKPAIIVGEGINKNDHEQKIHSAYDTFKVHSTGRLTINATEYNPGVAGGVRTTTATVNHGLGYAPMFAPFVDCEMERESYLSWNGQYNSDPWVLGNTYYTGQEVYNEDTMVWYVCKLTHTAAAANKPETGASWATYWSLYVEPDFYNTYVNQLEDQKIVYGGFEGYNLSYINFYSTSTQLVLELSQYCAAEDPPIYDYTPCSAETVYVDYTIFYNPAGEEFNLL